MGIVADINRSEIKFSDPGVPYGALDPIHRQVTYDMQNFTIAFGVSFDPDPKKGIGGAPADPDLWRIGIVQNVLFHHLHVEYENKNVFEKVWRDPVLDFKVGTIDKPFFGDAELTADRLKQRTVADVWVTPQGYGELLNPYNKSGVATNNLPDSFNLWDEPAGGANLRFKDGSMIKRLEKVVSFQTWLVAKTKVDNNGRIADRVEVLAHIPVFSLAFWLETTPAPKKKIATSLDVPPYDWAMFGKNGFLDPKKMDRKKTGFGDSPDVKPALGNGGKMPVLFGMSGNERANAYLTDNDLQ
jgi:hypothetical protein